MNNSKMRHGAAPEGMTHQDYALSPLFMHRTLDVVVELLVSIVSGLRPCACPSSLVSVGTNMP